jgi:hypothetical protein
VQPKPVNVRLTAQLQAFADISKLYTYKVAFMNLCALTLLPNVDTDAKPKRAARSTA